MPGIAARSAALSALVGAPEPPRAFTMLSSMGRREAGAEHLLAIANGGYEAALCFCVRHVLRVLSDVHLCLAVPGRRDEIIEDARRADDRSLLGMRERDLDHLDAEQRRIRILIGRCAHASRQLVRRPNARRAGDIDVDVVRILRVDECGVRVRAAARLHVADVLRIGDVRDVEDAQPAQALLAHGVLHTFAAAIEASGESLAGDEQQVLVHRHIALRCRTVVRRLERRVARIRDVPDLVARVAPLDRVRSGEREIGVRDSDELRRRLGAREHAQVPGRFLCVHESRVEADARIGAGRGGRRADSRRHAAARRHRAAAGHRRRVVRARRRKQERNGGKERRSARTKNKCHYRILQRGGVQRVVGRGAGDHCALFCSAKELSIRSMRAISVV